MSRLRIRLADMITEALAAEGRIVTPAPEAFTIAQGFYRTNASSDTYRWEYNAPVEGLQISIKVESYDTMTDCAKKGIVLIRDRSGIMTYEATAKAKNS
jgi:hypothetical protein